MKTFSILRPITLGVSVLVAATVSFAQSGSPSGIDAALAKLFGDVKAFSSKCETRILDENQQETMSMTMDFALLDGKIRAEVDMSQMKSKGLPPGAAASMKQMGMDRVISIVRPDKKTQHIIYPNMKACVNMPMPKGEVEKFEKDVKIEKTEIGKETIDGHPCVKNKVVITDAKGATHPSIVWNAKDMKDFPVQIQTTEGGITTVMLFKQIKLSKPDAALFDLPADYKQYDDMQAFMSAAMAKMMGSGAGNPQLPTGK